MITLRMSRAQALIKAADDITMYQELDGDITLEVTQDVEASWEKDAHCEKTRITIPAAFLLHLAARAHRATRGQVSVGSSSHPGGRGIVARAV